MKPACSDEQNKELNGDHVYGLGDSLLSRGQHFTASSVDTVDPYQNPSKVFFVNTSRWIPKFIWRGERPRIACMLSQETDKFGGLKYVDYNTSLKSYNHQV